MSEGRNRQIRRTFSKLGYDVVRLHRTKFGDYNLPDNLKLSEHQDV
jgi:16S rRNA U516 pseudouridylate synthase RsuA-like enzyme